MTKEAHDDPEARGGGVSAIRKETETTEKPGDDRIKGPKRKNAVRTKESHYHAVSTLTGRILDDSDSRQQIRFTV